MSNASAPTSLKSPQLLRSDFPFFNSSDLVYLDSAASAQKPQAVIDCLSEFYTHEYSNIHRGVYKFAELASVRFEKVREKVAKFINAASEREIVFTHGTTESINLVAYSWGAKNLKAGDEIIVSIMEHHANFVPWQLAAERSGAKIHYVGLTAEQTFDLDAYQRALNERTKLVAVTQLSNALGISPPLKEIVSLAKKVGAKVLIDGAQGIAHLKTDVQALGADFYAFSAHKLYGPTGIGVLWGREDVLQDMPPFLSGGDMIANVSVDGTSFREAPNRFEAGTPHIAGVLGLGAALDYLSSCDLHAAFEYEDRLLGLTKRALAECPEVRMLSPKSEHLALVCFVIDGVHPHDVAQGFSSNGVAIRAGHHCAQPLVKHLGIPASSRASFGLYNNEADVEKFASALKKVITFFRRR